MNDTTRNIGSVLGVAVLGSVAATGHRLPATVAAPLMHSADGAFVAGADRAALAAAIATALGVVVAHRALRSR